VRLWSAVDWLRARLPGDLSRRAVCLLVVVVMAVSSVLPYVIQALNRPYNLLDSHAKLLGSSRSDVKTYLHYDAAKATYLFSTQNAQSAADATAGRNPAAYNVTLPNHSSDGILVTDTQSKLSVTLTPEFGTSPAQKAGDHVVYPVDGGELAYTFKYDGLKEDIVVPKVTDDTLTYKFNLSLPNELSARVETDGSIGIYSADPALFGSVTYGTTADGRRVELARKAGPRTHLMFSIPAPVIKQSGSDAPLTTASFALDGEELTLTATHLKNLNYPISVDPSFIVTSASDFNRGNVDGNVDIDTTNNQLVRGGLTGGTISTTTWNSGTSFTTNRYGHATVAARGYLYVIGGCTSTGASPDSCATATTDVQYASIGSGGSITSWSSATALPVARFAHSVATYNNRIYVIDGKTGSSTITNTVLVADVNADGTLSAWRNAGAGGASSTTVTTAFGHGATASNGYIYVAGGSDGSSSQTTTEYAKIGGDGSLGSWTSGNALATARRSPGMTSYNGRVYVTGGQSSGSTLLASTEYATIQSDGSLNSWATTTSAATTRFRHVSYAYDGYLYSATGCSAYNGTSCTSLTATTEYAPIYADGELGAWTATSSVTTARQNAGAAASGGNLFLTGGCTAGDCTTAVADVQYAGISPAGALANFQSSADFTATGLQGAAVLAVKSTLYVIGGRTAATTYLNTIRRATINADGSLGTWTTDGQTMTNARYGMAAAYVTNNNLIYIFGGYGACGLLGADGYCQDVQNVAVNSDGTLNGMTTLATGQNLPNAVVGAKVVINRGSVYLIGGYDGSVYYNTIYYANLTSSSIQSNSGCGSSWCAFTSFTNSRADFVALITGNNYLYIIGGNGNGVAYDTVQYTRISNTGVGTASDSGCGSAWCTTTNMPQLRTLASGFTANGYIYVNGGCTSTACGTRLSSTIYAPIHSDGTIGSWSTASSISSARSAHNMVEYHGFVYVVAGTTGGSNLKDTQIATLNNGGSGVTGAFTTTGAQALPAGMTDFATVTYKNNIYVIGGCQTYSSGNCTTRLDTVYKSTIASDGTMGSWTAQTTLPEARSDLAATVYGDRLYIAGGATNANVATTDLKSIDLNPSTGAVGASWSVLSSFSTARTQLALAAYNGYIYVIGGYDGSSTTLGGPEYATLSLGGTLGGTWTASSVISSGGPSADITAFASAGTLYVLGGNAHATGGTQISTLYQLNSDGSLGAGRQTSTNGIPARGLSAAYGNGFLYLLSDSQVGGGALITGGGFRMNAEERAFASTTSSASHVDGGAAYVNGYVYGIGGCTTYTSFDCTTMNSVVEFAPVKSIARSGQYSRLLDGEGDFLPRKLIVRGTVPASSDLVATYATATTASPLTGSATSLGQAQAFINSLQTLSGIQEGRYFYMTLNFDGTAAASFPDNQMTPVTVTDFELFVRPAPNKRLRSGGSFTTGTAPQSLETNP
jgi:hypothetical protein